MSQTDCTASGTEATSNNEVTIYMPEDISSLFRLFEMDIMTGTFAVQHRVNKSKYTDDILLLGKAGLLYIYAFFCLPRKRSIEQARAWCVILSWIAEIEGLDNAPQDLEDVFAWLEWLEAQLEIIASANNKNQEPADEKAAE